MQDIACGTESIILSASSVSGNVPSRGLPQAGPGRRRPAVALHLLVTSTVAVAVEDVVNLDTCGGVEVLHKVSLRAEPGQLVALVWCEEIHCGPTGFRLYDVDAGAVWLNGTDVRELTTRSIRETVELVTQDGHLFHDTIRTNLLLARPEATEDELSRWTAHGCTIWSRRWRTC